VIFATIPYNRPYDSPACVAVVMHKDKEENSHHDSHYRARELAALAAYDHHHLDGEMFLQVSARECRAHYRVAVFTASRPNFKNV